MNRASRYKYNDSSILLNYSTTKSNIKYGRPELYILCQISLVVIAIYLVLTYYFNFLELTIDQLTLLSVIVLFISYTKILMVPGLNKFGFSTIIITYTFLSHIGFLIANYLDHNAATGYRSAYSLRYQYMDEYRTAIIISLFACIIYVLAIGFKKSEKYISGISAVESIQYTEQSPKINNIVFFIGMSLQTICLMIFLWLIYSLNLNSYTYEDFHKIIESTPIIGHMFILLSYAFCMMIAIIPFNKWKYGLLVYAIVMVVQFSLGNRGEVLYSAAGCFAIYYLRYRNINFRKASITFIIMVLLVPLIRNLREGKGDFILSQGIWENFIQFLAELGFQIAPFTYIVEYSQLTGTHTFGGTYLYIVIDFLTRHALTSSPDSDSIFQIKSLMPQDGIGFSHIAEAYYNFGFLGAGIYYYFFSKLITKLENIFISSNSKATKKIFCALLVVELINLTRNSFDTFPVYFIYILIIIAIINMCNKIRFSNPTIEREYFYDKK